MNYFIFLILFTSLFLNFFLLSKRKDGNKKNIELQTKLNSVQRCYDLEMTRNSDLERRLKDFKLQTDIVIVEQVNKNKKIEAEFKRCRFLKETMFCSFEIIENELKKFRELDGGSKIKKEEIKKEEIKKC